MAVSRLPEFHNELIEIVEFQCRKSRYIEPTHAVFVDGAERVVIPLYAEDIHAIRKAGYPLKQSAGPVDPPIPAIIDNGQDRLRVIVRPDGTHYEIRRRGEPRQPIATMEVAIMEDVMPETETTTQAPAPTGAATLYAKMARAMGKMKRIPKNGKNAHFNYEYATESDIADIVRETLAEVGIALFSEIIDVERAGTLTRVHMRYTFACTDTGATVERLWVGEADDRQDKGVSKAVTLATKYFLKTTFVISTGDPADDPDSGLGAPDPKPAPSAPKSANKPAPKPRGKQTEPASAPADDLEQRAKNFIAFAQKEYEMSVDEIKKVLGIKERLSEFDWSQGTVVASAKIDAWLNGSPDTKQPAGVTA